MRNTKTLKIGSLGSRWMVSQNLKLLQILIMPRRQILSDIERNNLFAVPEDKDDVIHPFAANWGDGTTSSSDGQYFRSGGHARDGGNVNPKYGSEPGIQFYTHVSDQYTPFHIKVINVGVRDATYVLDGLLYHESDLRIEEHYTDTSGFTDHVFA